MGTSSPEAEAPSAKNDAARGSAVLAVCDAVAVVRPTLLVPLWTMHLLGAIHGLVSTGGLRLILVPPAQLVVLSAAHTALLAAAYILNQITDAETDARNDKLMLVAYGHIPTRRLVIQIVALTALCLILVWSGIVLWDFGLDVVGVFSLSSVLCVAYSVPPLRLKARAGWDLVANAFGFGVLAMGVGWASVAPLGIQTWTTAAPYFLCVASTFAFTTIPDIPGDRDEGARTLGVVLGPRKTAWTGVAALAAACAVGALVRNGPALGAAFVALPLYTLSAIRIHRHGHDHRLTRTTQIVILTLSMVAALAAPPYAVWLIGIIAFARWYYARRFSMKYP